MIYDVQSDRKAVWGEKCSRDRLKYQSNGSKLGITITTTTTLYAYVVYLCVVRRLNACILSVVSGRWSILDYQVNEANGLLKSI